MRTFEKILIIFEDFLGDLRHEVQISLSGCWRKRPEEAVSDDLGWLRADAEDCLTVASTAKEGIKGRWWIWEPGIWWIWESGIWVVDLGISGAAVCARVTWTIDMAILCGKTVGECQPLTVEGTFL